MFSFDNFNKKNEFKLIESIIIGFAGMSYKDHFHGVSSIVEVECSGVSLPSNVDLMSITMFAMTTSHSSHTGGIIASINYGGRKCLTTDVFSSCEIDERNSRSTRLRTLVLDLAVEATRWIGCNVTGFESSSGLVKIVSWSLNAKRKSEIFLSSRWLIIHSFNTHTNTHSKKTMVKNNNN